MLFKCIKYHLSIPGDTLRTRSGLFYMEDRHCFSSDLTDCYSALGLLFYDKCCPGPHKCSKPENIWWLTEWTGLTGLCHWGFYRTVRLDTGVAGVWSYISVTAALFAEVFTDTNRSNTVSFNF